MALHSSRVKPFNPHVDGPRGLFGWYDATRFDPVNGNPADAASITTSTPWRDLSGYNNHMGVNYASGVTYRTNGRLGMPVVEFLGSSASALRTDFAPMWSSTVGPSFTMFAAGIRTSGSARGVIISGRHPSNGGFSWGFETATSQRLFDAGGASPGAWTVPSGWHTWHAGTTNVGNLGPTAMGWDGDNGASGSDAGAPLANAVMLFGAEDYGTYDSNLPGQFGEILIYAGPAHSGGAPLLSKADIRIVVDYLNAKWGHD